MLPVTKVELKNVKILAGRTLTVTSHLFLEGHEVAPLCNMKMLNPLGSLVSMEIQSIDCPDCRRIAYKLGLIDPNDKRQRLIIEQEEKNNVTKPRQD